MPTSDAAVVETPAVKSPDDIETAAVRAPAAPPAGGPAASPEVPAPTEVPVVVDTTSAGLPLRVHWAGRTHRVVADPVRWYERRSWWLRPGAGVEVEVWRVEVAVPRGARTLWLVRAEQGWSLVRWS